jgi:hypothetical protein
MQYALSILGRRLSFLMNMERRLGGRGNYSEEPLLTPHVTKINRRELRSVMNHAYAPALPYIHTGLRAYTK